MATRKGAHQRGDSTQRPGQSSQQSGGREAYERAYQQYLQEQAAARRAARAQGGQGQASHQHARQQNPYQQTDYQQTAYQRPVDDYRAGGYAPAQAGGGYGQYNQNWNAVPKKKGHPVRNTLLVLLVIVLIIGGVGGFTGYTLYNSAKTVRADASTVMSEISDLKSQVLAENPEQANATAADIAKRAAAMKEETSGWEWTVASYVPVYGGDVAKVKELANVLDELSTQAIVPLVNEVSQVSIKNLLVDGAINVDLAQKMVAAVNDAAPVIKKASDTLDKMGDAKLDQVNGPLVKARDNLSTLNTATEFIAGIAPTFTDMVGANGQRRTYLVVAQNNSEIRSTGGLLGQVGPLYVENGRIEMGDFRRIGDIYPDMNNGAPLTDEELALFGKHVGWQIADSNFIPDFERVGQIVKYAWETKGYGTVDGVIGVDPVFLQDMLAMTGGVTTSTGVTVDGSNAARLLLHEAYYLPTEQQDPLFQEAAALAFKQIMGNLGSLPLVEFAKKVKTDMTLRRLQVWMVNDNEEQAIKTLGADGSLSHDEAEPTLGIYFIDESYSKLFWYLKVNTSVGEGVKNADGSTTYPVTMTYWNMISDESEISSDMSAHATRSRSPGDMIAWVLLSAPAGGSITDMQCTEGEFMPADMQWRDDGFELTGTITETSLQGLDLWYGLSRTLPGQSFSLSFNVTTSPKATEPLKVVRTPNAQEVAGW